MTPFAAQLPVLLVAVPLLAVPFLYVVERFGAESRNAALMIYALMAVAAGLPLLPGFPAEVVVEIGGWPADIGIELRLDALARLFLPVVAVIGLLGTLGADPGGAPTPFYPLSFLLLAGSNGLLLTNDLFNAYVFLEITSISSYALVGFRRDSRGFESGLKYVLIGSLASIVLLWGIGGLFSVGGTLAFSRFSAALPAVPGRATVASAVLVIVGLLTKLGIVPFHAWKADALAGAPRSVAATLTGATVSAYFVVLVRFLTTIPAGVGFGWYRGNGDFSTLISASTSEFLAAGIPGMLVALSCASIIVGHLMALRQTRLSRLLAYSSVAHFGYIIGGVAVGTVPALAGAFLHAMHHAFMKAGLFLFIPLGADSAERDRITSLTCGRIAPAVVGSALVLLSMGMIGIPPAAGFASKWILVLKTARAGAPFAAILIAIGGAIALLYYLRLALAAIGRGERVSQRRLRGDARVFAAFLACGGYVFVAFWATDLLSGVAMSAAETILGGGI